ncbi:2-dehydro-3-deoxy-D-gluconate 5-dehydrogenase KduD [Phyllobacterium pellucidum]|uniref:2-dehydro-3-deoxy-D-gluconate 5-dehydrogenase KduD n=1 Tax=Phyllobacterium pellucidum TaxID=2740464 RepID=UPI001D15CF2B|nr:2-dehydro-3-deoxy-D-gluconate 5-dehydrogenase KduD [Phyllobacterium sp. T1018]UGY11620.1 2-dehydro-3-deoxy-D-gluconate 5-dehydrogenase KduD [Phyllobacterium sp. T1018]
MNPFDLSGRCAIVTGANTGIGQAIAVGLAGAGADIIGVGRSPMQETASLVTAHGRSFHPLLADLSKMDEVRAVIGRAAAVRKRPDILVNNAGIIRRADTIDFTEEDWDAVMDTNLKSAFFLCQSFARMAMAEKLPAKIINIASLLSFQGGIRVASYTAAKSGLAGLTRLMANEWAAHGINVNAIAPGYVETNNTTALRADAARNADILKRIPAGRWARADDMAGAAVFLASRASDYVHGAILPVDGGWLAR